MNVNEVKSGGLSGPDGPDRGRAERIDAKRRPAEAARSSDREAQRLGREGASHSGAPSFRTR